MKPIDYKPKSRLKQLGNLGESLAARYLKDHGYTILDRNFRIQYGEIDIVALYGDTLVFVEVKTRQNRRFGLPEESVTPWKMRDIIRTGEVYKSMHPELPDRLRIDVIGIILAGDNSMEYFRHIPNASS